MMSETTSFDIVLNALFGRNNRANDNKVVFMKRFYLFLSNHKFSCILKERESTRILDFRLSGKTNFRLGPDLLEFTFHADFSISKPFLALKLIFRATEI